MKIPVSVIVLTHNSEKTIERCLKSVSWSKDVCIIDDFSTDSTLKRAEGFDVRVAQRRLEGNFSKQRNFAVGLAKNDWILFVDSDEVVSSQLAKEVEAVIEDPGFTSYKIPRLNHYFGRWLRFGEFLHFSVIRLLKKGTGEWVGAIHEVWKSKKPVGQLHFPIYHYQQGGVQDFLQKINFYSSIRAQEFYDEGKRSRTIEIFLFPAGKFAKNYILKLGIFDGVTGLINALSMSFYTFMVRAKLWLLWHEARSKK